MEILKDKLGKKGKLILKIAVSSILLAIIFSKLDWEMFFEQIKLFDLRYAPLIALLIIVHYFVGAFRWKALLIHENGEKISVKYLINLYFVGAFFNNFMPTSIGGDVYKVVRLGKKLGNTFDAFSATFVERFSGVVVLSLISVFSLIDLLGMWGALLFVGFFIAIYVGLIVLSLLSHKVSYFKKIYDSLLVYKGKFKVLLFAFVTSFIVQVLSISTQYLIFVALGVHLPIFYSLFIFPVITLAGFFIPSLNGVGVQDYMYQNLFLSVGVAGTIGLSASILYHLFRLLVSLIGGVIYAFDKEV